MARLNALLGNSEHPTFMWFAADRLTDHQDGDPVDIGQYVRLAQMIDGRPVLVGDDDA